MPLASAETLALKALGFLAESPDILGRFLAASGVDVVILRDRAGDPEFLAAVMEFLLTDDSLVTAFCEAESLDPKTLHLVRHALPGG